MRKKSNPVMRILVLFSIVIAGVASPALASSGDIHTILFPHQATQQVGTLVPYAILTANRGTVVSSPTVTHVTSDDPAFSSLDINVSPLSPSGSHVEYFSYSCSQAGTFHLTSSADGFTQLGNESTSTVTCTPLNAAPVCPAISNEFSEQSAMKAGQIVSLPGVGSVRLESAGLGAGTAPQATFSFIDGNGAVVETKDLKAPAVYVQPSLGLAVSLCGVSLDSNQAIVVAHFGRQPPSAPSPTPPANLKSIALSAGWNMVSLPTDGVVDESNAAGDSCGPFTGFHFNPVSGAYEKYSFNHGSSIPGSLGFWARMVSACRVYYAPSSTPSSVSQFPLSAGWNQVGWSTQASFDSIRGSCSVLSGPWEYSSKAHRYQWATMLQPGHAYFVKVSGDCALESTADIPPLPQ